MDRATHFLSFCKNQKFFSKKSKSKEREFVGPLFGMGGEPNSFVLIPRLKSTKEQRFMIKHINNSDNFKV